MEKQTNVVAIVGRPNVGKSCIFNRLAGKALSLVDSEPGVTRDRIYAEVRWRDRVFDIVDTGGFSVSTDELSSRIKAQIEFSIREAACIVWALDVRDGVTGLDEDIAETLRPSGKKVVLAVNKADNTSLMQVSDFYSLGMGEPVPISALHGLNTDVLLDRICALLPKTKAKTRRENIRISIVGRPNVGKSSLINALLKDKRVIVDDSPGTTRGVIPIPFSFEGSEFTLLDTSGLKKSKRISTELEKKMMVWTRRVIRHCDISILLLDIREGITSQDARICDYIWEKGRGLIIAFNKCDLVRGDEKIKREYAKLLRERIMISKFCPVIFISALYGDNIFKLISMAEVVAGRAGMRIQTSVFNSVIDTAVREQQAQYVRGTHLKVFYATQASIEPPTFIFFVNDARLLKESYRRYLMNVIYSNFDFSGIPIRIFFRTRERK